MKNIAEDISSEGLHDVFSVFGEILSCNIAQGQAGQSKGFGFVHFSNPQDADVAMENLNGKCLFMPNLVFI